MEQLWEINMIKRRETELDILRIIALLAVILIHALGMFDDEFSVDNTNYKILTFISAIITWQVPVYVMISGRFFLDTERKITVRKIINSLLRLVIAFVVWNIVYQTYYILNGTYNNLNIKGILSQAIIGPYHFWFLYMLICLYAIVPFLRKISENKRLMEYFIILFLLFEFVTYYGTELPLIGSTLADVLVKTNFHFAIGYSGYYILGYYLYKYKLPNKFEFLLYGVAAVLLVATGTATVYRASIEGFNGEWFTKYLMPNIVVEASAIYVFFTKRVSKHQFSDKAVKIITKLSEYSFGVYLVHALVAQIIVDFVPIPNSVNPLFVLFVDILIVFAISNIIVWLLRFIPIIGKKIT